MNPQKVSVDLRIVCGVLLVIIVGMLVAWQPWDSNTAPTRTIDVVGEASIEAEPDEFQFYPVYRKKGADKLVIQQELIAQVNEVIAKLKELGVDESDITLSSNTYDNFWEDSGQQVVSNSLTISVNNKELSQKVLDYLVTTAPDGQVTPYPTLSKDKEKEVENQARTKALADAKQKADTTANELGVKVGKVVSVDDQQSSGIYPMTIREGVATMEAADSVSSSLPVLPGKQDINYTITVKYELK
jgi:uncharacterized protein YggE